MAKTFKQNLRTSLKDKYITLSGRASRSEYWHLSLAMVLVMIACFAVVAASMANGDPNIITMIFMITAGLVNLLLVIPMITTSVRRLHDINKSGWWFLAYIILAAIPVLGIVICIVFLTALCIKGTDGDNRFGPDPLADADTPKAANSVGGTPAGSTGRVEPSLTGERMDGGIHYAMGSLSDTSPSVSDDT